MIKNLKCFRDLTQKNIDKELNFRQCAVCLHQNKMTGFEVILESR